MLRLVKHKGRVWRAIVVVAPIRKEVIAHSRLIRGFKKPCRNDLVSIDVADEQWNNPGSEWRTHGLVEKMIHTVFPQSEIIVRTSIILPVSAVAAAARGEERT